MSAIDNDYPLIPITEIEDEAREIAVLWVSNYQKMSSVDLHNKHKLASDIMNYARRKSSDNLKNLLIDFAIQYHKRATKDVGPNCMPPEWFVDDFLSGKKIYEDKKCPKCGSTNIKMFTADFDICCKGHTF